MRVQVEKPGAFSRPNMFYTIRTLQVRRTVRRIKETVYYKSRRCKTNRTNCLIVQAISEEFVLQAHRLPRAEKPRCAGFAASDHDVSGGAIIQR